MQPFIVGLYDAGSIKSSGGTSPTPTDDGFTLVTATVVADASMDGKPIEIRLGASSGILTDDPDSSNFQVFFDDVNLTTTAVVTVPSAIWLFGSGLLGLVGIARRKKAA